MKHLVFLAVSLFTALAMANVGPKNAYVSSGEKINNQGLDATRTFELENLRQSGTWDVMLVYVQVTDADNSTTALNMSCTASEDNNTTDWALQECTVAGGVATCLNLSWTKNPSTITSPKKWLWVVNISGIEDIECTFTDTGGVAGDLLDVAIALAVGN